MDTSNVINLLLLIVTGAATAVTITQAVGARKSNREAGEHERAANAAREEAATSTTRVANLLQEQNDREADWVPKSHGGGHLMWDMVNRTGRRVVASLEFPDASEANIMESKGSPVFEDYVNAGQGLEFRWERRGVPASSSVNVDVIWSAEDRSFVNKVTRVRVHWPSS